MSLAGCAAGASVCDTVFLSRASSGLCVQKSTGDVNPSFRTLDVEFGGPGSTCSFKPLKST